MDIPIQCNTRDSRHCFVVNIQFTIKQIARRHPFSHSTHVKFISIKRTSNKLVSSAKHLPTFKSGDFTLLNVYALPRRMTHLQNLRARGLPIH